MPWGLGIEQVGLTLSLFRLQYVCSEIKNVRYLMTLHWFYSY